MAKKLIGWRTKGMNMDTSPSAFSPEFAFENRNIRLSTNEGNTQMSWVNERGTKEIKVKIDTMPWSDNKEETGALSRYRYSIEGFIIGTAVLDHKLILFTVNEPFGSIYVLKMSKNSNYDIEGKRIAYTQMGFKKDHPIETLPIYESEFIQKVYWTDNLNPPRVINISSYMDKKALFYTSTSFDFNPTLQLKEEVQVEKMYGSGEFPSGVIQYAFTYYNKYMQESAIFYVTPLQYISYADRGGSPENTIANAFKIKLKNIDRNFEYLRIYSILRTSKNTTPLCKRVTDLLISDNNSSSKARKSAKSESNLDGFGNTLSISNFAKFSQDNGSYYVQGAACYGKYLFQGYIGGKFIDVVDLETNQKVGTLKTDVSPDNSKYHGNVLSFGKDIPKGSDFPYLYYSAESNDAPCIMVIKISNTDNVWSGNVVQYIYLPKCDGGQSQLETETTVPFDTTFAHYFQNGCVDVENNCIWVSGYTKNSYIKKSDNYKGNTLFYRKYPLPKTSSQYYYFSYKDVQDSFSLPFKKGTQGMVIKGNKLYQCFGYDKDDIYDEYLDCIDLSDKKLVYSYNFPKEQLKDLGEELESPYIYNGNLYLSATCKDWKYYTLWNLSFSGGGDIDIDPTTPDTPGKSDEWDDNKCDIIFVDSGTQGEAVDPTELLYKDGSNIIVKTIEQKDGTLFLGNIQVTNSSLPDTPKSNLCPEKTYIDKSIKSDTEDNSKVNILNTELVKYQEPDITVVDSKEFHYLNSIGVSGFKNREYYRIGIQFQHILGQWSEPVWLKDYQINKGPSIDDDKNTITLPQVTMYIGMTENVINPLVKEGYKKARLLMAQPSWNDRTILYQGIANSCLYQETRRYVENIDHSIDKSKEGTLYGQASWMFRPWWSASMGVFSCSDAEDGGGYIFSTDAVGDLNGLDSVGTDLATFSFVASPQLYSIEVGGDLNKAKFKIDEYLCTIHSPECVFDKNISTIDLKNTKIDVLGHVNFRKTYGDIDIQTSSPTIGSAGGFIHRNIKTAGNAALVSGLYYEDYLVDDQDSTPTYGQYYKMKVPVKFPVFMWHKDGSLNNDVQRDGQSAKLLKKRISNYHLVTSVDYSNKDEKRTIIPTDIKIFSSDELSMVKLNNHIYMGNIDTAVTPYDPDFKYFAGDPWRKKQDDDKDTNCRCYYRLGLEDPDDTSSNPGVWELTPKYGELPKSDAPTVPDTSGTSGSVSAGIHLPTGGITFDKKNNEDGTTSVVVGLEWKKPSGYDKHIGDKVASLCITSEPIKIKYKSSPHIVALLPNDKSIFETAGEQALPLVEISRNYDDKTRVATIYGNQTTDALKANTWIPISNPVVMEKNKPLTITSNRGDTWYQRYECLKTYPFTSEDVNQVIDIASFMVETHINIDGRYDRNRAQINNLNMSPKNFNLINSVYSQLDNFFNYKILDEDDYRNINYPNQVTWSKTKDSGSVTDPWTNITLASVLEMDGDKGSVNKLIKLNNQLICLQDSGISQILYNENAQVSTTAGVPIELANSGKVQGKRYYTNTIGCSNKWSVVQTPSGIYFMDSNDKGIYIFNGELKNITMAGGLNTWAKQNIPSADVEWNPVDFDNFVSYYDAQNQEVLFINKKEALAFSEKFSCFTSFYDYAEAPYLCNLDDTSIWIKNDFNEYSVSLWQHQAGEYCNFFGENKGYSMTLIGNQEPQTDKIFTNIEFRACVEGEGVYTESNNRFSPTLPFDTLEVWDEYQHGVLNLSDRNGHGRFTHGNADGNASLNRKFRMWRCDVPRDNAPIDDTTESKMGIKRFRVRPLDRIRNPWAYFKLSKKAAEKDSFLSKVEVHDIIGTYFS